LIAQLTNSLFRRTTRVLASAALALATVGSATAQQKDSPVRFINPSTLDQNPRYTQIVEVTGGRLILISGQAATDKSGQLVGKGDFRKQAEQVFANIKAALEAMGATTDDVVKLNSYIVDIQKNLGAYREVRTQLFGKNAHQPGSTTVGVAALVNPDMMLEVEATVVLKDKQ
jgi:enamine deaminase RidA (YjgF/YER057c/UK114 family)